MEALPADTVRVDTLTLWVEPVRGAGRDANSTSALYYVKCRDGAGGRTGECAHGVHTPREKP